MEIQAITQSNQIQTSDAITQSKSNTNERWGIKDLFDSDVQITILSV